MEQVDEDKRNCVVDLIKDAGFGFLSTIDDDQTPCVRPMMPHLDSDTGLLLLAVLAHSRTLIHVQSNPNVEICYVNRQMSYCRISGEAKISQDLEKKEMVWNNIPMLRNYFTGPADEKFQLIIIDPESIETMLSSQKVPDVFNFRLTQ